MANDVLINPSHYIEILERMVERLKKGEIYLEKFDLSMGVYEPPPSNGYRNFEKSGEYFLSFVARERKDWGLKVNLGSQAITQIEVTNAII